MNIILCNKNTFKYFEDYIYSLSNIIKYKLILFDNCIDIKFNLNDNFIFVQNIDNYFLNIIENNKNIYLINTEQLSVEHNKTNINKYSNNIKIIEYNYSNLKHYIKYEKYLLPYQINHNEIFNYEKTKDVCLIGEINCIPKNRQNIINILKEKNISIDIVSGFNKERDNNLFKYKIILNISYDPDKYKIMETFRCDRCVYNKMIVISDLKDDMDKYYLKKHVIFTEYENIPNMVIEVLNNYDNYYNKLVKNINYVEIENKLSCISNSLIQCLMLNK